jgi:hypothetical protein
MATPAAMRYPTRNSVPLTRRSFQIPPSAASWYPARAIKVGEDRNSGSTRRLRVTASQPRKKVRTEATPMRARSCSR